MESGGPVPHSQGLSNNPYPEPYYPIPRIDTYILSYILILYSHLRLGLPNVLFPVGLPVNILKALPSSILVTRPEKLNLLDLINLAANCTNCEGHNIIINYNNIQWSVDRQTVNQSFIADMWSE